ncbi:MAG TPA: pitrilysin family protein [Bacillota bacterium]|nr:pitrilysin family protein [Bacillota bacterium]
MEAKNYPKIDETIYTEVLDNGLKVCLLPKRNVSEVNAFFTTKYGANDISFIPLGETESIESPYGVAHFLEHKMFDKGDYDAFERFTELGANANAYTNPTQTAYLFDTTENAIECVEWLLDYVQDPYFTEETVEKEKGIITQEAQMYADNPDQKLYMETLAAMFQNHPVRYEVIGTIESINKITKDDLYTCYHTFYHPSNMTLCVTGNFDEEEMMHVIRNNQARKTFAEAEDIKRFKPDEPSQVADSTTEISLPVTSPKVMFGIKEYADPIDPVELKKHSLLTGMILDYLFGRSGQYFKELYDQGIVDYSFGYTHTEEDDFGYFVLTGNTPEPEKLISEMKRLLASTNDLKLSEIDFKRIKKRKVGNILRSMNAQDVIAQKYIWYDNHGLDYFEVVPYIQSLTLEDMNTFINSWYSPERLSVCTVKPE